MCTQPLALNAHHAHPPHLAPLEVPPQAATLQLAPPSPHHRQSRPHRWPRRLTAPPLARDHRRRAHHRPLDPPPQIPHARLAPQQCPPQVTKKMYTVRFRLMLYHLHPLVKRHATTRTWPFDHVTHAHFPKASLNITHLFCRSERIQAHINKISLAKTPPRIHLPMAPGLFAVVVPRRAAPASLPLPLAPAAHEPSRKGPRKNGKCQKMNTLKH